MRSSIFCLTAAAAAAVLSFSSCGKDDPEMSIAPVSGVDTYTIKPDQTLDLEVKVEHFGKNTTSLTATSSDEDYTVTVGALAEDGSATVSVAAPKYILSAASFTVTVGAADSNKDKEATQVFNISSEASPNVVVSSDNANSFVVKPGSLFGFKAVKGNSTEAVEFDGATLLWQDAKGLVSDVFTKDGYVYAVLSEGTDGNAVVAASKESKVQWSWHLWVTDYDPATSSFSYTADETTYTMMDRSLGALSSESGSDKAHGNFYQWGRKDPFPGSTFNDTLRVSYNLAGEMVELEYTPVAEVLNVETSIANPTTYYTGVGGGNYSWVSADFSSVDKDTVKDLWGGESGKKSLYDPCPTGWKVAPIAAYGFYTDANYTKEKVYNGEETNKNMLGRNVTIDGKKYFFASQGEVYNNGNYANGIGTTWPSGKLWSANADNMSSSSYFRGFFMATTPSSVNKQGGAFGYGLQVRCVKE